MIITKWKYASDRLSISRTRGEFVEWHTLDSEVYQQLLSEGYQFEEPNPEPILPPPPPTIAERLEAAEQLIDMLLEDANG